MSNTMLRPYLTVFFRQLITCHVTEVPRDKRLPIKDVQIHQAGLILPKNMYKYKMNMTIPFPDQIMQLMNHKANMV